MIVVLYASCNFAVAVEVSMYSVYPCHHLGSLPHQLRFALLVFLTRAAQGYMLQFILQKLTICF